MDKSRERRESLVYHAKPKPGKIEVIPTKKYNSHMRYIVEFDSKIPDSGFTGAICKPSSFNLWVAQSTISGPSFNFFFIGLILCQGCQR